ncbi:MAG: sigma-70 family RNA polymerase sigma factor [Planctomycetes bacterium]|nr:sigma-70 family RNA polymerase sigma factor [Planctomycetota bacterium]
MYAIDRLTKIRLRGSVLLEDLDAWVQDPAAYEAEREALIRAIVQHRWTLFPGEASDPSLALPFARGSEAPASDLYASYISEIRRIPTMTREEEFRYVLALEMTKHALEEEMRYPRPSAEEIDAMASAVHSQDATFQRILKSLRGRRRKAESVDLSEEDSRKIMERAHRVRSRFDEMLAWKRMLVYRTLQLVPGMARKYRGLGVPTLDLIQEANAALMKATDRYEWRKGVRFVVYARWWVQQGILKSLSCHSRTVRTPVYLAQKIKKLRDLDEQAFVGTGEHLSAKELGEKLDEPTERIERALAAARMTVSIDRELDPSGEFVLRDTLIDRREPEQAQTPQGPSLHSRIEEILGELNDRERLVLELRFGLHEQTPQTLEKVSQRLGVSRERIRQIQEQALRKLQRPSKKLNLSSFITSEE